jgi:hypothetical protein
VSHRRWDTIDAAWTWRELPERSATCVAYTILSAPRRQTRVCKRALMHCGNSPLMWRVSSSVQERSFNYIKGNAIFVRDLIELLLDDPVLYTCCELLYSYESLNVHIHFTVKNGVISETLTTPHILYSSLVSICDYFLGCLLWCQCHIQHSTSVLSKKVPA